MSYESLFVHELESTLEKLNDISILDMRDKNSFANGHLTGAKRVEDDVIKKLVSKRKENPAIIIYCYRGHSSRDLASFFSGLGFTQVYNLEGGWHAWQEFVQKCYFKPSAELNNWLLDRNLSLENINGRIEHGMTPLMLAALAGEEKFVTELVEAGSDVNLLNDDRNNALWFSCVSENLNIIHLLIKKKIDIDNINVNGSTSLIYASSAGKISVVRTLVEAGADISITTPDDYSALDIAANLSILKYLKPKYINH